MATLPSLGNTSTPKLVPSVTMTSAHAVRIRNSAQMNAGESLACTGHLKIREFTFIDFETDVHWLTANLAILDIRLIAATWVEQNAAGFPAERASDSAFHDCGVHLCSGLESLAGPGGRGKHML